MRGLAGVQGPKARPLPGQHAPPGLPHRGARHGRVPHAGTQVRDNSQKTLPVS